jgi:ABC-type dipeptide/oligopeptide/nickel transport system permease subunit
MSRAVTKIFFMSGGSFRCAIFPVLEIFIKVFGINILGDGLRDIFDPKLRRQT